MSLTNHVGSLINVLSLIIYEPCSTTAMLHVREVVSSNNMFSCCWDECHGRASPMCVASLATNSGQPELSSSTQWLLFVSVCNQSAAAGLTGSCRTPAPAPWRVEVEHVAWRTNVPAATPLRHAAVWRVLAAARKSRRSPVAQRTVQVGSQTMFVALY